MTGRQDTRALECIRTTILFISGLCASLFICLKAALKQGIPRGSGKNAWTFKNLEREILIKACKILGIRQKGVAIRYDTEYNITNMCELKFYSDDFTVDRNYIDHHVWPGLQ